MQLFVCTHDMWVGMPTPLCIKQFRFRDKHTPEMSLVKHIIERNWRLPFRFPNQSYLDSWYPRLTEPRPKTQPFFGARDSLWMLPETKLIEV